MSLSLLSRYAFFAVCVIFTLASLPFIEHEWLWPITLVTGVLSLIGIVDLLQSPMRCVATIRSWAISVIW